MFNPFPTLIFLMTYFIFRGTDGYVIHPNKKRAMHETVFRQLGKNKKVIKWKSFHVKSALLSAHVARFHAKFGRLNSEMGAGYMETRSRRNIGKYIYCNKIQWIIEGQQQILPFACVCVYIVRIYGSIKRSLGEEKRIRKSTININWS